MTRRIFKFPFDLADEVEILMPDGATVLFVDKQNDRPTLWADCDTERPVVSRYFVVRGTGQDIPRDADYVDSWFSGPFVWHLLEVTP